MIVIALECGNESLRGLLTRWLLEVKPGVFVGNVTAAVREELVQIIIRNNPSRYKGAVIAYSTNTEQGFELECIGDPKKTVIDLEGIKLIKTLKD